MTITLQTFTAEELAEIEIELTISEIDPNGYGCAHEHIETFSDKSWFFEMVSEDQNFVDYNIYQQYRRTLCRLAGGISLSDAPFRLKYVISQNLGDLSVKWLIENLPPERFVLVDYKPLCIAGFRYQEDLILFKLANDFWKIIG